MPDGNGVVLLGCDTSTGKIYQLSWIGDDLQWITKQQKLDYHRNYGPVAMWIPDELTSCTSTITPDTTTATSTTGFFKMLFQIFKKFLQYF